jgi:hypothetical protein
VTAEWIVIRLDAAHPGGYERYQTDGRTGHGMPKLMELAEAEQVQGRLNRAVDEAEVLDLQPHAASHWVINHHVKLTPPP